MPRELADEACCYSSRLELRQASMPSAAIAATWRAIADGSGSGVGVLTPPRSGMRASIDPASNRGGAGSPIAAAV